MDVEMLFEANELPNPSQMLTDTDCHSVVNELDTALAHDQSTTTAVPTEEDEMDVDFRNLFDDHMPPVVLAAHAGEQDQSVQSTNSGPASTAPFEGPPKIHSTSEEVVDKGVDPVVSKIETMLESMVDVLLEKEGELTITLRIRPSARPTTGTSGTNTTPTRDICFPGKTPEEAWRFTVLIRILGFVHEALTTNVTITKRDIYYRHPALFVKQAVVDKYIDDLAFTFGVPRLSLNVSAAAKGLFAGAIMIRKANGSKVYGCSEREGLLVPKLDETDTLEIDAVRWILVVEKEATFRSLATCRFWETLRHQGVMITAKGYPDLATRYLLRAISYPSAQNNYHCPPVHILVDFDPDGIDILSTYKHGSIALAHETAALKLPDVRWLGVKSSETLSTQDYGEEQQSQSSRAVYHGQGLLSLSRRDRTKATRMLAREKFAEDGPETEWRRETQVMLMLNIKAEIQILEQRTHGLAGWLEGRLH